MRELKINKACCCDNIPGDVIKILYNEDKEFFFKVMNKIWISGKLPGVLKITSVVLIPKEGRNLKLRDNNRSISLLPSWSKVMDTLITIRLTAYLDENKVLHDNQYGYRKQKGTNNALSVVKEYVKDGLANKQVICMVSLDIKNAFNTVNKNDILSLRIDIKSHTG